MQLDTVVKESLRYLNNDTKICLECSILNERNFPREPKMTTICSYLFESLIYKCSKSKIKFHKHEYT